MGRTLFLVKTLLTVKVDWRIFRTHVIPSRNLSERNAKTSIVEDIIESCLPYHNQLEIVISSWPLTSQQVSVGLVSSDGPQSRPRLR